MAEEAQFERWNHTAAILSFHANLNRDPKKKRRPFSMKDFHPMKQKKQEKPRVIKVGIEALKHLYVDRDHKSLNKMIGEAVKKQDKEEESKKVKV